MKNSNNTVKLVGALLVGAAIGALGAIFALNKDGEVGKLIADKTDELGKSIKEKFTAVMDEAKREFDASKAKALELLPNGKGRASEYPGQTHKQNQQS